MRSLSIRNIRAELPQLDRLIAREGEIIVTRRGRPIARLLPIASERSPPCHAALRASMPRLKQGSAVHIRKERDER